MYLSLHKHHLILIYLVNTLEQEKKVKCYSFSIKNICKAALTLLRSGWKWPLWKGCGRMPLCSWVFMFLTYQIKDRCECIFRLHNQQGVLQLKAAGGESSVYYNVLSGNRLIF